MNNKEKIYVLRERNTTGEKDRYYKNLQGVMRDIHSIVDETKVVLIDGLKESVYLPTTQIDFSFLGKDHFELNVPCWEDRSNQTNKDMSTRQFEVFTEYVS